MKTGLAVSNPRISEGSIVATQGSDPAYALEYKEQHSHTKLGGQEKHFLLDTQQPYQVIILPF